jgi:hypothetical protein
MNCKLEDARPDWKAYVLGEMEAAARRDAEMHAAACSSCQDELGGVRVTLNTLSTLREEEVPRRIAFVSDKVFEPKWWQMFLRPSFAAGAVVAAAILAHGFMRPATVVGGADAAAIEARVSAEVEQRVQGKFAAQMNTAVEQAVNKAVADTEKRDDQRMAQLLTAAEQRYSESADILNKQVAQIYAMNTGAGVR